MTENFKNGRVVIADVYDYSNPPFNQYPSSIGGRDQVFRSQIRQDSRKNRIKEWIRCSFFSRFTGSGLGQK